MTWLVSSAVALISGVAGLILAGIIGNACVSWFHVSSREGASGYFVVFLALGGGLAGVMLGLITARMVAAQWGPGFGRELAAALGLVLGIAGISAVLCRALADVPPEIDGRDLNLEVEFRFPNTRPVDRSPAADGEWEFTLASLSGHTARIQRSGTIQTQAARLETDRWIVPAAVGLFTERGGRSVRLALKAGGESFGFLLPLPRHPGPEFLEWSEWLPRQQSDGQPWPADRMSCRFRVQKTVPPPPPKSDAEVRSEQAAEEEAKFAAIPPDSPIEAWFPYLAYEQPHTQRALHLIAGRPHLVVELNGLVVSEDPERAYAALRCIAQLPQPPRELVPAVEAAGRVIAERITSFNQTPREQDPDFAAAVDPATRFYGWITAAKALREKAGGDFAPELKVILELSRVRPESHCMRQDICRVASYYLQVWTGIPPLPTDPKPD